MVSLAQGTYFQNVDYSHIRPDLNDVEFVSLSGQSSMALLAFLFPCFISRPPRGFAHDSFLLCQDQLKPWLQAAEILQSVLNFFQLCLCTRTGLRVTEIAYGFSSTELC